MEEAAKKLSLVGNILYNTHMVFAVSTFVLGIIAAGLYFRHRARLHVALMGTAFTLDLLLLLYVEFTRHAIEKLGENLQHAVPDDLLYFHVAVSALTLVLYGVQIYTGRQLLRKEEVSRSLHRRSAYLFLASRLLNYVTSFFVASSS